MAFARLSSFFGAMRRRTAPATSESLLQAFKAYLHSSRGEGLREVLGQLPRSWDVYVLGGLPRELALRQSQARVADIDLVVGRCSSQKALFDHLERQFEHIQRNRFGGAKFRPRLDWPVFDVWRLEDHLVPPGHGVEPRSIQQVLKWCLTNIDALAIDARRQLVAENRALHGLAEHIIELQHVPREHDPHRLVQLVHLILLWEKYESEGFRLATQALDALRRADRNHGHVRLMAEVEEKLRERQHADVPSALRRIEHLLAPGAALVIHAA